MPRPPYCSGNGQAEDAELGHLLDDLHRDQLVALVPAVRERDDLLLAEATELIADHLQRLVDAEVAEVAVGDQLGDAHPRGVGVAALDQLGDGRRPEGVDRLVGDAHVARPHHFDLRHRDAAGDLRQIFAVGRLQHQVLEFAELPRSSSRSAQTSICCSPAT